MIRLKKETRIIIKNMIMKKMMYNDIDLRGDILRNIQLTIGKNCELLHNYGGYYFYIEGQMEHDYFAQTKAEIYAYFAGILKH